MGSTTDELCSPVDEGRALVWSVRCESRRPCCGFGRTRGGGRRAGSGLVLEVRAHELEVGEGVLEVEVLVGRVGERPSVMLRRWCAGGGYLDTLCGGRRSCCGVWRARCGKVSSLW